MVCLRAGGKDMGTVKNCFRSFGRGSCDPIRWEPYFVDYDPKLWDGESGGLLQFHSDDGKEYTLLIKHLSNLGFLLDLSCRDLCANRSIWCKYSVKDRKRLSEFEKLDDLLLPRGCFLLPHEAWLAVEDFLREPTQASDRVEWIDACDIPWPEM
jgi:hypothetical protein